jgi:eukaryotic-like serine/threonine-protein kinase
MRYLGDVGREVAFGSRITSVGEACTWGGGEMRLSAAQMARAIPLLDEPFGLDPEGRRRWLEALPPEHHDLLPWLRRVLLPEDDGASEAGALPGIGSAAPTSSIASSLREGETVGPYRLIRPLGAGGMAEVWLAQRADGAFKRKVALKLPMLFRLRQDLASRFARERDILAALEHPNIARLYDAGVSSEGLPYLAMEYVRGEPLTDWCNAHRLGIRERLKVFLQVLDAVQYAHGLQVIHRDIKPSNILVTVSGQVRLLDFGVAKLLVQDDEQTELTQQYGRALTPEYACPELVRGDAIDPTCDVYSLGVVLYELLCGTRPYRLKAGASMTLLEQAIATAQVERPSRQLGQGAGVDRNTTQDALARRLRGDLDAIVLKAMARAREDRYGGAAALADDLQRCLSGEPVEARPAGPAYRLGKFVLRHQAAMAWLTAAIVPVAAAIGYALAVLPGAQRVALGSLDSLDPAMKVAPAEDKSIAVLPFVDMSEKHDQEYFSDGLSEELIDHLSRSPNLRVIARTSSFYFKGKQVTIHEIADALHVSHVLEGSVRKAGRELRITAQLVRASDGSHLWSKTFDRNFNDLFKVQEEIAETVAQSLKVALGGARPNGSPQEVNAEAYNLLLQGNHFSYFGTGADDERAIQLYRQAIEIDPNYGLAWVRLAESYSARSLFGSTSEAEDVQRARRAVSRALDIDPRLPDAYLTLANLKTSFDWDWRGAQADLDRARALDPKNPHIRLALAELRVSTSGRINDAIRVLEQELAHDPLLKRPPCWLGFMLYFGGRLEESETAFKALLQLNPSYPSGQAFLARSYLLDGKYLEALAAVQKESDESWKLAVSPMVYWALGRRAESDASLAEERRKYATASAFLIAQSYAYRGEPDAAFEWLDRAYREHNAGMRWILVDPILHKLHNDPRFGTLLTKMNIAAYRPTSS